MPIHNHSPFPAWYCLEETRVAVGETQGGRAWDGVIASPSQCHQSLMLAIQVVKIVTLQHASTMAQAKGGQIMQADRQGRWLSTCARGRRASEMTECGLLRGCDRPATPCTFSLNVGSPVGWSTAGRSLCHRRDECRERRRCRHSRLPPQHRSSSAQSPLLAMIERSVAGSLSRSF